MKIITDPHCVEYSKPGIPEAPARVNRTLEKLQSQKTLSITWEEPLPVREEVILRAHTAELLKRLAVPEDFDEDTPTYPHIAAYARKSIGGALAALKACRHGDMAFSLMRPPGHHATRNRAMGFCYLNTIAVAAMEAQAQGFKRIAIFDFDVHHGNGTEDILLDKPGFVFISVHQSPEYPWTGKEDRGSNCYNFPVPPDSSRADYLGKLSSALEKLKQFNPDLIAVSAGFDAYRHDPLSKQHLDTEDYHWLGRAIRNFQTPTFSILEGGYSNELPDLILAYLCGLEGI